MIQVTCACGATMQVQDENAGKQCKCPKCGAICQIPAAAETAAPVAAAPAPAPAAAPPAAAPPAAAPPAAAAPAAVPVAGARPGGLTALAVLNFVFGGLGIIVGLGGIACGSLVSSGGNAFDEFANATRQAAREAAQRAGDTAAVNRLDAMGDTSVGASLGMFYFLVMILLLALAAFLIVAGVGYLKQSRKSGYVFGNIYGIVGIVLAVLLLVSTGGANVLSVLLVWLAYPIVTLALLNTVFKESFPNP